MPAIFEIIGESIAIAGLRFPEHRPDHRPRQAEKLQGSTGIATLVARIKAWRDATALDRAPERKTAP